MEVANVVDKDDAASNETRPSPAFKEIPCGLEVTDDGDRHIPSLPSQSEPCDLDAPCDFVRLAESGWQDMFCLAFECSDMKVLELGCGTGSASLYLARHGYSVLGVDINSTAIAIATRRAAVSPRLQCAFSIANILECNLPTADLVIDNLCYQELCTQVSSEVVIDVMANCCRIGGRLLILIADSSNPHANCKSSTSNISAPELVVAFGKSGCFNLLRIEPTRHIGNYCECCPRGGGTPQCPGSSGFAALFERKTRYVLNFDWRQIAKETHLEKSQIIDCQEKWQFRGQCNTWLLRMSISLFKFLCAHQVVDIASIPEARANYKEWLQCGKTHDRNLVPALRLLWFAHMLKPLDYQKWCLEQYGHIIPGPTPKQLESWEPARRSRPWRHRGVISPRAKAKQRETNLENSLPSDESLASLLQLPVRLMHHGVHKSHVDDPHVAELLSRVVEQYRRWQALQCKHPKVQLVPHAGIDWVWHAHLISPHLYYFDSVLHGDGTLLDRKAIPAENSKEQLWLIPAYDLTVQLYELEYKETYSFSWPIPLPGEGCVKSKALSTVRQGRMSQQSKHQDALDQIEGKFEIWKELFQQHCPIFQRQHHWVFLLRQSCMATALQTCLTDSYLLRASECCRFMCCGVRNKRVHWSLRHKEVLRSMVSMLHTYNDSYALVDRKRSKCMISLEKELAAHGIATSKEGASIDSENIEAGNGPSKVMQDGSPETTTFKDYLNSKKLQREVERETKRIEIYLGEMQRCVTQLGNYQPQD